MEILGHWANFERDASRIVEQTRANCEREFDLLRSCFDLYSEGFNALPKSGNGESQIVRIALLSQNLNTFNVMINSASQGFYIQALIPLRNVYENWLSFWYLAKHPQEAQLWLDPTWKMHPPKAERMRNRIDHPSKQIKSKLQDFYEELNRFAHTDPAAVLSRLNRDGEKTVIDVGTRFDAGDFRACTYGLSLWLGNCLDSISSLIPDSHEWQRRCQSAIEQTLNFIDEYNTSNGGVPVPSIED